MTEHCIEGDQMCRCGNLKRDHHLTNYADGPHVGAGVLICPVFVFQESAGRDGRMAAGLLTWVRSLGQPRTRDPQLREKVQRLGFATVVRDQL